MIPDRSIAIVVPDESKRSSFTSLLASEGFRVKAYSSTGEFVHDVDLATCGCLLLDSDPPHQPNAVNFATRWSQQLPIILITTESSTPHQAHTVLGISKSTCENRLIHLVHGALDQSVALHS